MRERVGGDEQSGSFGDLLTYVYVANVAAGNPRPRRRMCEYSSRPYGPSGRLYVLGVIQLKTSSTVVCSANTIHTKMRARGRTLKILRETGG